jgi:phospholipid-binding lipoprotein MlaA
VASPADRRYQDAREDRRLRPLRSTTGIVAAALLAGCAVSPDPGSLDFDPFEAQNRSAHAVTRPVDRAVYGPVARAWGEGVPPPLRRGVTNLHTNWKLPGQVIQYALQGRGLRVAESAMRFAVNTTFGLGGLLDVATGMDLPYRETNFDETFHVWGVPEGGYLELPLVGPGTQRDWTGWVLDQVADPAWYVLPVAAANGLVAVAGLDLVNERYALDPAIDEILHRSADSYTAQRISYLQNMRARLQGGTQLDQLEDVYAGF